MRQSTNISVRTTAYAILISLSLIYLAAGQTPQASKIGKTSVHQAVFGESVRSDLKPGDADIFLFRLEAGTSVRIDLGAERDFWIDATSFAADIPTSGLVEYAGKPLGRVEAHNAIGSVIEPIVISAEETGSYGVRIEVPKNPPPGHYSLIFGTAHTTSDTDRAYTDAAAAELEIQDNTSPIASPRLKELFQKRVDIFRRIGDDGCQGLAQADLARFYNNVGDIDAAIDNFRHAGELFARAKSVINIMAVRSETAELMEARGDYEEAIKIAEDCLEIARKEGSILFQLKFLNYLGIRYHRLGDATTARDYYEQEIALAESSGPMWLGNTTLPLRNLSNLLRGMNGGEIPIEFFPTPSRRDREQSLQYMLKVLEIERQYPNPYNYTLWQIGDIYGELGNYPLAEQYLERAASGYLSVNQTWNAARLYMSLAGLHVDQGNPEKAIEILDREIPTLEAVNPELPSFIAKTYFRAGQSRKALAVLNRSTAVSRKLQHLPILAASLFQIAEIEKELGNFDIARQNIEEAIEISESLRNQILGDVLRRTYFATVKGYYDFYVDLLMQAAKAQPDHNFAALALTMSEKGRSRSMLDLLSRSHIDIHEGVNPQLLQSQRNSEKTLINKAAERNRLLISKHTDEEVAKINREVAELAGALDEYESKIRKSSPRYASLTQPRSLSADEIVQLVGEGTVMLEYHLGEKKSYLWAISDGGITSFDLPAKSIIEDQARSVYDALSKKVDAQRTNAIPKRTDLGAIAVDQTNASTLRTLAHTLIAPAAQLIGNKRLVIVPDGVLNYVPFAAIPGNDGSDRPLAENHEIVTLPSSSVLALLRSEEARHENPSNSVAVFADPVFGQSDARTKGSDKTIAATPATASRRVIDRAANDVGLVAGLSRLPFSRREARAIAQAAPASLIRTDFDANKTSVFVSGLDKYRIIHFATHGLLDGQHPELSGIVLSLVDKDGKPIDGFLRLQDIYNLKLNADLVVLSACNTALGKEVRGEGLIGLTRGFMFAGAPRVVASLWKVDDAATAELMSIFYRKMLQDQLRPAAALRAAQMELSRQPRWRSPYYWAPFVLQGEWK